MIAMINSAAPTNAWRSAGVLIAALRLRVASIEVNESGAGDVYRAPIFEPMAALYTTVAHPRHSRRHSVGHRHTAAISLSVRPLCTRIEDENQSRATGDARELRKVAVRRERMDKNPIDVLTRPKTIVTG
jgi:hypothetical protein